MRCVRVREIKNSGVVPAGLVDANIAVQIA